MATLNVDRAVEMVNLNMELSGLMHAAALEFSKDNEDDINIPLLKTSLSRFKEMDDMPLLVESKNIIANGILAITGYFEVINVS